MTNNITTDDVILVDIEDNQIGTMPKLAAHLEGKLHRAFSVFIFNTRGELLLQQRAFGKYHSGGKWTNTCCSHPRSGEDTIAAAHRRLQEEMGMDCKLEYRFNFTYKALVMDDLVEHEYDHVFFGVTDESPVPEAAEVASFKYMSMEVLAEDIRSAPEKYTEWLKLCFDKVAKYHQKMF